MGQAARYERFMAKLMYALAQGAHIDADRVPGFAAEVQEAYKDPFKAVKKQPQTAKEIIQHVLDLLEE